MVLVENGLNSEQVSLMRPNYIEKCILVLERMVLIAMVVLILRVVLIARVVSIFSVF